MEFSAGYTKTHSLSPKIFLPTRIIRAYSTIIQVLRVLRVHRVLRVLRVLQVLRVLRVPGVPKSYAAEDINIELDCHLRMHIKFSYQDIGNILLETQEDTPG